MNEIQIQIRYYKNYNKSLQLQNLSPFSQLIIYFLHIKIQPIQQLIMYFDNFDNIGYYDFYFNNQIIIYDQKNKSDQDNRTETLRPYEKAPYNAIGKLLSYFQQQEDKKKKISFQGTAFYIGKNLLLTVAHNICNFNNQMAKQVYFYPAQSNEQKRIKIKAKQFKKLTNYSFNNKARYGPNISDLALIQLQENSQFKSRIQPLKIKWDYKLTQKNNSKLILAGYPSKQNQHPQSCYMYEDQKNAACQDQFYIYYKHSTSGGQSGMPIIQIDGKNNFWLIGVHKACMQFIDSSDKNQNKIIKNPNQKKLSSTINFGLNLQTLKSTKEMICQLAQQMKVQQLLGQNYKPSYKKLLQENNMLKKDNQSQKNKVQQIQKLKKQNIKLKNMIQQLQKQLKQQNKGNEIMKKQQKIQQKKSFFSFLFNNQLKYKQQQQQIKIISLNNTKYKCLSNQISKAKIINQNKTISTNQRNFDNDGYRLYNLIDRVIYKNGSKIIFLIQSFNPKKGGIDLGMCIKSILIKNNFKVKNFSSIGHGMYIMSSYNGYTYSHSQKQYNSKQNDFSIQQRDRIQIRVEQSQIIFIKNNNKRFKMPIKLTQKQFNQLAFCIHVYSWDSDYNTKVNII